MPRRHPFRSRRRKPRRIPHLEALVVRHDLARVLPNTQDNATTEPTRTVPLVHALAHAQVSSGAARDHYVRLDGNDYSVRPSDRPAQARRAADPCSYDQGRRPSTREAESTPVTAHAPLPASDWTAHAWASRSLVAPVSTTASTSSLTSFEARCIGLGSRLRRRFCPTGSFSNMYLWSHEKRACVRRPREGRPGRALDLSSAGLRDALREVARGFLGLVHASLSRRNTSVGVRWWTRSAATSSTDRSVA